MTQNSNMTPALFHDDVASVIGETGDTVVYVFPTGGARVQKGQKLSEQLASASTPEQAARPSRPPTPTPTAGARPPQRQVSNAATLTPAQTESLAERLLADQCISPTQLQVAQYDMSLSGLELADVLVARGWMTPEAIAAYL